MQGLFRGGEVDSGENFMVGHVSPLGDLLRRVDLEPIHTRLLDKVSNEKGGQKNRNRDYDSFRRLEQRLLHFQFPTSVL